MTDCVYFSEKQALRMSSAISAINEKIIKKYITVSTSAKTINDKCGYILVGKNSIKQATMVKIPRKAIIFKNIKFLIFIIT